MARAHLYRLIQDAAGNLIPNAQVSLCAPGTSDPISATIWANATATDPSFQLDNPFTVTNGVIDCYLDVPQRVLVAISSSGMTTQTFDNIDVEAPASPLDPTRYNINPTHTWQDFCIDLTAFIDTMASQGGNIVRVTGVVPDFDNDTSHYILGPGNADFAQRNFVVDFSSAMLPTEGSHLLIKNLTIQGVKYHWTNSGVDIHRSWFINAMGTCVVDKSDIFISSTNSAHQDRIITGANGHVSIKNSSMILDAQASAGLGSSSAGTNIICVADGLDEVSNSYIRITSELAGQFGTLLNGCGNAGTPDDWGSQIPFAAVNNRYSGGVSAGPMKLYDNIGTGALAVGNRVSSTTSWAGTAANFTS